jgi:putative ABC transport system permease protein
MTLFGYALRDLLRNPRRTLASAAGVVVGVGLFSAVLFFIDGSGAAMTKRAVAPLTLDMQRVLTTPVGLGLRFEQTMGSQSLAVGDSTRITLTVTNDGLAPAHEVVVRDLPLAPLTYVPGSTMLDGQPLQDIGNATPLSQPETRIGLNIGTVAPAASRQITFDVTAARDVPQTSLMPVQATISSREALKPTRANAPVPTSLASLADQIGHLHGVKAADPLVFVDMAAGSISANGKSVPGPAKLFSFNETYQTHYPSIKIVSGGLQPGRVLISAETSRVLRVGAGDAVTLTLPGGAAPLSLKVSGITDLSGAAPLFESRLPGSLEQFVYVPYTIVVDSRVLRDQVAPAFERAAAMRGSKAISLPVEEVDVMVDRGLLNADPATAVGDTQKVATEILGVAQGQDYLIDNISNTLQVATGDAAVAKRMFIYLGLPGAIVAAILTAYAGTLLAGAQRRENALLRARGATRQHLLTLLAFRTVAIAGLGSLLGTALGFVAVATQLGHSVLFEASTSALLRSALIGVFGGMLVTALALYIPGRRLINREIKPELAELVIRTTPRWRRFHLDFVVLLGAVAAQLVASRLGAFNVLAGSVYAGRSVSLPLPLLAPPIVVWLVGTLLIARIIDGVTTRLLSSRQPQRFGRLLPGLLWRSIARRLSSTTGGVVIVGLVVGLGTTLICFSAVYNQAKAADARFLVGSDIRITPNPTTSAPHPTSLSSRLQVAGLTATTPVVYSAQNAVLTSAANEDVATLAAVNPNSYRHVAALQDSGFLGGSARQLMSTLQRQTDGILVNKVLADGLKLKVGDSADVLFGRGTSKQTRQSVKVVGLFTQLPGTPNGADIVANLSYYQHVTGLTYADYYLASTPDRSIPGLNRAVRSLAAIPKFNRNFTVQTTSTALNKDQSSLTSLNVRGLLHLDSFFTFLMAATATAMIVFGLLLQRRREYVTLRAQGLESTGIRRLVLAESGVSTLLGTAIGLLVGVAAASQFGRVLRPIFTLPPALQVAPPDLAVLTALVLGATALSSAAAAILIGRLKPTELLRDE